MLKADGSFLVHADARRLQAAQQGLDQAAPARAFACEPPPSHLRTRAYAGNVAPQGQSEGTELARVTAESIAASPWEELDAYGKRAEDVVTPSGSRFRVVSNVFWDTEPWESDMYVIVKVAPERGWRRWWPYKAVRARGPDSVPEPVEGAPRGGDPEVHLHTELGEEAKRLATHPREEAHRLSEELKAGEVETTPLIALTGIGIALGLFIAFVIALVFVVAYLI
jgi:hypothetical protein